MHFLSRIFFCLVWVSSVSVSSAFSNSVELELPETGQESIDAKHPQSLSDSVGAVLSGHPQLKAMMHELYAKMAEVEEREALFLPQLVLSLGIGREYSDNSSTRSVTGEGVEQLFRKEASLSLRQLLYDGSQTHWQKESSFELSRAQRFNLIDKAETLALEAVEAHLVIAKATEALNDHLLNLQTHERIARDIAVRARLGKDDRAKIGQVNARLSLSLANLEVAKEKLRVAKSAFYRVVGKEPSALFSLPVSIPVMPESLEVFAQQMLLFNPRLKAESRKLKARKAAQEAVEASGYPFFYLESGASWNDDLDGVRGRNDDAYVMLRMDYDLFNGGRNFAAKTKAAQETSQTAYRIEDLRRDLNLQAETVWFRYESLKTRVGLLQDYVDAALSTKSAYEKQFDIGQRSLIDLLDAENELLKAKRLHGEAKHDLYLIRYNILSLQGALLSHLAQTLPVSPKISNYLEGNG